MNANMELAEESVDLDQRILRDLVLQSVQSGIDILEAPMELVLDFREPKGRSTERKIEGMTERTVSQ